MFQLTCTSYNYRRITKTFIDAYRHTYTKTDGKAISTGWGGGRDGA